VIGSSYGRYAADRVNDHYSSMWLEEPIYVSTVP
jgi:hypothetical protein